MAWRDYRDVMRQIDFDMDRFTEDALMRFLDSPGAVGKFWQPAADVHETDAGMVVKLELAGVTTDSVQVSLSGDGHYLAVSGVRAEPEHERSLRTGCTQIEIYWGPFERTFVLPREWEVDRDALSATLRDGFLTIMLPKARTKIPVRTITIELFSE